MQSDPAKIDKCIKIISAKMDIDYSTIYSVIFQDTKSKTIDIPGIGIVPIVIPNAQEINRDPDTYVKKYIHSTEELERLLLIASYLYYNIEKYIYIVEKSYFCKK